jgi:hypothetical protein
VHAPVWSPLGDEIWASRSDGVIEAVPLRAGAPPRQLASLPQPSDLHDLRDRRLLLASSQYRVETVREIAGSDQGRDLSWFDQSHPRGLSGDGKLLLLEEFPLSPTLPAGAYVRPTDGGPAVRLADGLPYDLSADGKWALVRGIADDAPLSLVPTGAGAARPLPRGRIAVYEDAAILPDGRRALLVGAEAGRPPRTWLQELDGKAEPRPVTDEGVTATQAVAPDGSRFAAATADGRFALFPTAGGAGTPLPLDDVERPVGFDARGEALFVLTIGSTAKLVRFDLATNQRTVLRTIRPPDRAGVDQTGGHARVTSDGRVCVYDYIRTLSEMFLVDGLR